MSHEIFAAIKAGDAEKVRALLASDSQLARSRDANGVSAILTATYHGHAALAQMLANVAANLDVFEAAALGQPQRLQPLLDKDPNLVHSYSGDGWTPLHLAAAFGGEESVRLLLARGADARQRSKNPLDNTALHASLALRPSIQVAAWLLGAGADINAKQHGGYTALHQAAASGNLEMIEFLLSRGADAGARTDDGKTPADLARERGKTEAAVVLV
jgi:ankyrin repeat protein